MALWAPRSSRCPETQRQGLLGAQDIVLSLHSHGHGGRARTSTPPAKKETLTDVGICAGCNTGPPHFRTLLKIFTSKKTRDPCLVSSVSWLLMGKLLSRILLRLSSRLESWKSTQFAFNKCHRKNQGSSSGHSCVPEVTKARGSTQTAC